MLLYLCTLYGEQYAATLQERGRIGGGSLIVGMHPRNKEKSLFRPTLCTVKLEIFLILSFLKRSAPLVLKPDAAESLRLGLWGGEQDKNTVGAKSVISVMGCDTVAEGR